MSDFISDMPCTTVTGTSTPTSKSTTTGAGKEKVVVKRSEYTMRRRINARIEQAYNDLIGLEVRRLKDLSWRAQAECTGTDTSIFVPDYNTEANEAEAREYCDRCPVRVQCLIEGLTAKVHGTWGGLSESERDTLRRMIAINGGVATVAS